MELILWRHADAEDPGAEGDAGRRLTKKGRKQAERMAEWLGARVDAQWRILVSPAKRAVETVKPLDLPYEVSEAVGTSAGVSSVLRAAEWPRAHRSVIVVGHNPTFSEIAQHLTGAGESVIFRKGAVWWFEDRDGAAILKAVMTPELLEG